MSDIESFSLRIHRIGSSFPDQYSMDFFITSRLKVWGTCRSLRDQRGFLPFEFPLSQDVIRQLRDDFLRVTATPVLPQINVGLTVDDAKRVHKSFAKSISPEDDPHSARFFQQLEFICTEAIAIAEQ